jgi:hypothetical protein
MDEQTDAKWWQKLTWPLARWAKNTVQSTYNENVYYEKLVILNRSFIHIKTPLKKKWKEKAIYETRAHATGQFGQRSRLVRVDFAFSLVKSEVQD